MPGRPVLFDDQAGRWRLGILIHTGGACNCGRPFDCGLAAAIITALREEIEAAGAAASVRTAPALEKGKAPVVHNGE